MPCLPGQRRSGLGHHTLNRHRLAPLPLALVGRLHEGEDFERFLRGDGGFPRLEELDDLGYQRPIPGIVAGRGDSLGAEDRRAVAGMTLTQTSERPDAPPLHTPTTSSVPSV